MSGEILLRQARPEDSAVLAEIEKLCFPDPWSVEMMEVQIFADNGIFIIAENENGVILGYAGCRTVLDEGYITNVAVSPSHRRRGVAGAILDFLEAWSREKGLSFLSLEVRESNASAIALYEKRGFVALGVRPNYYEYPRESAIIMTLYL